MFAIRLVWAGVLSWLWVDAMVICGVVAAMPFADEKKLNGLM